MVSRGLWTWYQLQTLMITDRHTDTGSKNYVFSFFS